MSTIEYYLTYKIPWPIVAVLLLVSLFLLISFIDKISLNNLLQKHKSNTCSNLELAKAYESFFKYHPMFSESTSLIIAVLPVFIRERYNIIKWIKKINSKDLSMQSLNMLLFDYFFMLEYGLTNEVTLLKDKTYKTYAQNDTFNLFYNMFFSDKLPTVEIIDAFEDRKLKGIAYYYLYVFELKNGDINKSNIMKEYAEKFLTPAVMKEILNERKNHEKEQ